MLSDPLNLEKHLKKSAFLLYLITRYHQLSLKNYRGSEKQNKDYCVGVYQASQQKLKELKIYLMATHDQMAI